MSGVLTIEVDGIAGSLSHLREVSTHYVRRWIPSGNWNVVSRRGEPILCVRSPLPLDLRAALRAHCLTADTSRMKRGDVVSESSIYGVAKNGRATPVPDALVPVAAHLWSVYGECAPTIRRRHGALRPTRPIGSSRWTTAAVNANSAVGFHRDAANAKGCWSGMVVLTHRCDGGALILPEYGIGIHPSDGTMILFNGAEATHGVTPITLLPGGYRYSIPFFTLTSGVR